MKLNPVGTLKEISPGCFQSKLIPLPFGKGNVRVIINDAEKDAISKYDKALENFLRIKAASIKKIASAAYANYKEFQHDTGIPDLNLENSGDILNYISPYEIEIKRDKDGKIYVFVFCECKWEHEHGLQIVLRNGSTLTRISAIDHEISGSSSSKKIKGKLRLTPVKPAKSESENKTKKTKAAILPSNIQWTALSEIPSTEQIGNYAVGTMIYFTVHSISKTSLFIKLDQKSWGYLVSSYFIQGLLMDPKLEQKLEKKKVNASSIPELLKGAYIPSKSGKNVHLDLYIALK